jgi:hypothetical protein
MLLFELLLPMSALLPALLAVAAGTAEGTMLPPPLLARGAALPLPAATVAYRLEKKLMGRATSGVYEFKVRGAYKAIDTPKTRRARLDMPNKFRVLVLLAWRPIPGGAARARARARACTSRMDGFAGEAARARA